MPEEASPRHWPSLSTCRVLHKGSGAGHVRLLKAFRLASVTRPRHEPIGHPQYLCPGNHPESELLVEAYVLGFVGLEVGKAAVVIHDCAEGTQHSRAYPLALLVGIDRNRTQVPVRFLRIAARPLTYPPQDSQRRTE